MQRRKFINNIGLAAAGIYGAQYLQSCGPAIKEFGIQLWTLKEDMAKDPKATLKAVAEAGYKQIESFTGEKGIFWGMKAEEFKKYITDLGLNMISSHIDPSFTQKISAPNDDFQKLVNEAAKVGVKYLINPFPGEFKTSEEWKKTAEGLNMQGVICKSAGLTMGYHNHHFEFLPTADGMIPEQYLLDNTDKDLVKFELDLYWVVKAGQDPIKWLNANKGRIHLVHVKDLHKKERLQEIEMSEKPEEGAFWPAGASTTLGNGQINFPEVLKVANETGVKYFIVEQERFDNSTHLLDIKKDAQYMKTFKYA
jgi:sugar phosphate isomerase/epimerase